MQVIDPAHPREIAHNNIQAERWTVTDVASKLVVS